MFKDSNKCFCFAAGLLGLILIGLGVFLLATGFILAFITIGLIIAGILLLALCRCGKCSKNSCLSCLLLTLITLFLIITGILAILSGAVVIGLILIGLGVLAALLDVVCLIFCLIQDNNTLHFTEA